MRGAKRGERGIGIIEVVVALGLLGLTFGAISAIMQFSIRTQRAMTMRRTAIALAEEGMEVARFERDSSLVTFWARPVETPLYPEFVGIVAQLTTTNPGPVNGIYTRDITLSRVFRDAMGNIDPMMGATEDTNARSVAVDVSWVDTFESSQTYTVSAYVMRISQ